MSTKRGAYLFLIFLFAAACQSDNISKTPANFAKKSIESIPMESVDAETGGKKGGGTHFSISSGELYLDYQYFDDEAGADIKLDAEKTGAKQVVEQGDVAGNGGAVVGKFTVTEERSRYENNRFCLRWTRVKRYAQVCSASRQAIEEFRTVYEL